MGNSQSNPEPPSTGSPKAATRPTHKDSRRLILISPMDTEQQRQEKDGREGGGRKKLYIHMNTCHKQKGEKATQGI